MLRSATAPTVDGWLDALTYSPDDRSARPACDDFGNRVAIEHNGGLAFGQVLRAESIVVLILERNIVISDSLSRQQGIRFSGRQFP